MQPLTADDIRLPAAYEPDRDASRRRVIELKRDRRVALGDVLTLVFENRETVRGVVEELVRAERIDDSRRVTEELEVFNELIPGDGELSATLFIEVTDAAELHDALARLRGIEEHVHLEVGGLRVGPEEGRTRGDRISSVHYLRFHLGDDDRERLLGGAEVAVVSDHPAYPARAELGESQRAALAQDLRGSR